jgi:ADP-glucose pyrophosphorylase
MKPHAPAAIIFKNSRRLIDMVVSNAIDIKKVLDIHKYKVRNSISA